MYINTVLGIIGSFILMFFLISVMLVISGSCKMKEKAKEICKPFSYITYHDNFVMCGSDNEIGAEIRLMNSVER